MSVSTPAVPPHWTDAAQPMSHSNYRPDVDGLRALAVLAVVIFHAEPMSLPGGFTGVDVFFVISGYLISGIIMRELGRDAFSLLGFYARRVKRIFPALIVVLASVWLLGRLVLLADEYQLLGKHMAMGAGFIVNLNLFADTKDYFGAINSPLIHLWSLGVEEQFYLMWPLFLLATYKLGQKQVWLIAAVALASFALNVAAISSHPLASFYLPSGRLWELSMGGLLAHAQFAGSGGRAAAPNWLPAWLTDPAGHVRASIGMALLIFAFAMVDSGKAFPGWWAMAPCAGAFLLISAGPNSWFNRYVLGNRLMVFIGLISYPLYLWHWPLLSLAHSADWREFTPIVRAVVIAASFVLAFLTYRYVETPIRRSQKSLRAAGGLCTAMTACAALGILTFTMTIPPRTVPQEISRFADVATELYPYPEEEGFLTLGDGSRRVLFIGDSTIAQYHPRIARVLEDNPRSNRKAVFAWRAGCAPVTEQSLVDPAACEALLQEAVEYSQDPSVDTVVIGFCWYAYFVGILDSDRVGEPGRLAPGTERALEKVKQMIADMTSRGKRVYLVLQLPVDATYEPRQMIRRTVFEPGFRLDIRAPSRATMTRTFDPFVSPLLQIAQETGAMIIDPMSALCNLESCPAVTPDGEPIYRDSWHLRHDYVREQVDFFDKIVLDGSSEMHSAAAQTHATRE